MMVYLKAANVVVSLFPFVYLCLLFSYFARRSFLWMWSCMHIAWRSNNILWISLVQFPFYILRTDSSHHIKLFLLSFVEHAFSGIEAGHRKKYCSTVDLFLSLSFPPPFSISFVLLSPALRSSLFTSCCRCVCFNWLMEMWCLSRAV